MPGGVVDPIDGKDLTFEPTQGCVYYQGHRIPLRENPLRYCGASMHVILTL